jgi:hypothetical protein
VEVLSAKQQQPVMPVVEKGFDPLGQKLDLTTTLPTYNNPKSIGMGPNIGTLSRERANRTIGMLEGMDAKIQATTEGTVRPSILTGPDLQVGLQITRKKLEYNYKHLSDGVMDFRHIPAEETPTGVDYVRMNVGKPQYDIAPNDLGFPLGPPTSEGTPAKNMDELISNIRNKPENFVTAKESKKLWGEVIIGTRDALPFKSVDEADKYAQHEFMLDYKEYRVTQGQGDDYYISVVKPVDITDKTLRALSLETRNKNNESAIQAAFGHYLSPANQTSQFVRDQRLIATTAPTNIYKTVKDLLEPVKGTYFGTPGLSKYSKGKLNDVLEYYRDYVDYSAPQVRGTFPVSMVQLQKDWKKVTGVQPTPREQDAFWAMVKINDYDWTIRNYNVHRNLARRGVEHHSYPHPTEGEGFWTDPVMAKEMDKGDFGAILGNKDREHIFAIYKDGEWSTVSKLQNNLHSIR